MDIPQLEGPVGFLKPDRPHEMGDKPGYSPKNGEKPVYPPKVDCTDTVPLETIKSLYFPQTRRR